MRVKYINIYQYNMILVSMLTVAFLCMSISCTFLPGIGDSDAETEGYKLYTGRKEGFRISLEYPPKWHRDTIKINNPETKMSGINLKIPSLYSSITVTSDVNRVNGGEFIDASSYIERYYGIFAQRPEFKLIERKSTYLGSVASEEIIYSYRFTIFDAHGMGDIDRINLLRSIAADHNGRIYCIDLYSTPPEYENIRNDFEHLVRSFKFLN